MTFSLHRLIVEGSGATKPFLPLNGNAVQSVFYATMSGTSRPGEITQFIISQPLPFDAHKHAFFGVFVLNHTGYSCKSDFFQVYLSGPGRRIDVQVSLVHRNALLAKVFCSSLSESGRYPAKSARLVHGNVVLRMISCTSETRTMGGRQIINVLEEIEKTSGET